MNTTGITTNAEQNVEEYEDRAMKKRKAAIIAATGGAGLVAGAAIAGGTAFAASPDHNLDLDDTLSVDDVLNGAEVGPEAVPEPQPVQQSTTQYVYVEKPQPVQEPENQSEPEVIWEETDRYVVNDQVVATTQQGTVDGHKFMIVDADGDNIADVIAIDANDNGVFESDEVQRLTPEDKIFTLNKTAHTRDHIYEQEEEIDDDWIYPDDPDDPDEPIDPRYGYDPDERPIHNNFEDEKTGERYDNDFAYRNPDYNPRADVDYGSNEKYLAEDHEYDREDYHAGISDGEEKFMASADTYPDSADEYDGYYEPDEELVASTSGYSTEDYIDYDSTPDYISDEPAVEMTADTTPLEEDSFDSMMGGEEFIG